MPYLAPIPGYVGLYAISPAGDVWRVGAPRGRPLKPVSINGYQRVVLSKDNVQKNFFVHQLMLLAFVGPCPADQEPRHLDGDRANNRRTNLCYGTRAENQADRTRHGRDMIGEKHGMAKLTEADVLAIRAATKGIRRLGDKYGVSRSLVDKIRARHLWKHI